MPRFTVPLHSAASENDVDRIQEMLNSGIDINSATEFGETALHVALDYEAHEAARFLIENGADVNAQYNLSAQLKQNRSNPGSDYENLIPDDHITINTPMREVFDAEIAYLLYRAGAPLKELDPEIRAQITGAAAIPQQKYSDQHQKTHATRIFGTKNPELTNHAFWLEQIRTNRDGTTNAKYGTPEYGTTPGWSFNRFGTSTTELPDGRWIEIAGEHEDAYMPNFCIYNDVIVHDIDCRTDIYSYPRDVFPPTDFHTATLVDDVIYIIGNLGYSSDRLPGTTPVYRLNVNSFEIVKVETTGNKPGWISRHDARLEQDRIVINGGKIETTDKKYEPQTDIWELSLDKFVWTKLDN